MQNLAYVNLQPLRPLTVPAPLAQGSLYEVCAKPTTPQSPNGASSTKARLRIPQALLWCPYTGEPTEVSANTSEYPYTGEPIEVSENPIQCHKPKPPLCKGRGTTLVVEGLSKPV